MYAMRLGATADDVNPLLSAEGDSIFSAWYLLNVDVTPNVATAPDGSLTADRITSAGSPNLIAKTCVAPADVVAYTICCKMGSGATHCNRFAIYNNTTQTDLADAAIDYGTGALSGRLGYRSVVAGPNGWYKLTLVTSGGVVAGNAIQVYAGFVGGPPQVPGENAYMWGARVADGAAHPLATGLSRGMKIALGVAGAALLLRQR